MPRFELLDDNTGARARDHLANERTYLAWIRTALSIVTIGVAFHEFVLNENDPVPLPLAVFLVILGIVMMAYSLYRYFRQQRHIEDGIFGADYAGPVLLSIMLAIVMILGLWLVLT